LGFDRRKALESAQKFLMKGQIRKAISEYERLVAEDPRNIRIRSKLADLCVRSKNIDRAVEEYTQLAKQYEEEDLSYRAISMYKRVLTLRPKMIDVHYWLADLYKKEGLFGNAKVLYQNIIKLNPEDQVARGAMAEIDQTMMGSGPVQREHEVLPGGQPENRIIHDDQPILEEPLDLDAIPEMDEPLSGENSQAEEIIELEDPEEHSAENLEPAQYDHAGHTVQFTHQKVDLNQEVSPEKDLESHYHLGIAYMEMDLIDQAIAEFEAALGYAPKQIDCLFMLGQCYTEKGVFDRSIFYLEKALRLEGLTQEEYIRINTQLARAYKACGMKEKAWQAFERAGLKKGN